MTKYAYSDQGYLLADMPPASRSKNAKAGRKNEEAENSFRRVSKYQNGQIVALTLAFIFSTAACLTLSYANFVLTPDCVLFAKWSKTKAEARNEAQRGDSDGENQFSTPPPNDTDFTAIASLEAGRGWIRGQESPEKPILDLSNLDTKWGRKRHCYVTQYGFAAAAVTSFILCWFFVFFRPTREAYFLK